MINECSNKSSETMRINRQQEWLNARRWIINVDLAMNSDLDREKK